MQKHPRLDTHLAHLTTSEIERVKFVAQLELELETLREAIDKRKEELRRKKELPREIVLTVQTAVLTILICLGIGIPIGLAIGSLL